MYKCSIAYCTNLTFTILLPIHSAANSLAANGNTPLASTVPVTLSAVYFEDYLTGAVTEVTATYTANACATTAYLNGATPSAVCGFSTTQTETELLTYPAFCQVCIFYTLSWSRVDALCACFLVVCQL